MKSESSRGPAWRTNSYNLLASPLHFAEPLMSPHLAPSLTLLLSATSPVPSALLPSLSPSLSVSSPPLRHCRVIARALSQWELCSHPPAQPDGLWRDVPPRRG